MTTVKRYSVTVAETTKYKIEVEATSTEQAESRVRGYLAEEGFQGDEFSFDSESVTFTNIEENKPSVRDTIVEKVKSFAQGLGKELGEEVKVVVIG